MGSTYKRVDGLESSLHWLVHRFSWDNTWSLQFNSLTSVGLDWSLSIDSVSEWIDDTSEHTLTNGHINNRSGSLDNIAFLDLSGNRNIVRLLSRIETENCTTYLSFPRMTIPTLSVSKFRAIPLTPDLNSTISPAWTLVNPKTLAIPSPMEITDPNSFKSFCKSQRVLLDQI